MVILNYAVPTVNVFRSACSHLLKFLLQFGGWVFMAILRQMKISTADINCLYWGNNGGCARAKGFRDPVVTKRILELLKTHRTLFGFISQGSCNRQQAIPGYSI